VAAVVAAALREAPPSLSARRLLERLDVSDGAREALHARVEISSANSADVVAARDLTGIAHVDREPASSIAGGNQRLALALADRLGAAIRLGSPVHRVVRRANGVRVATARAELDTDVCVIAAPASVLDRIAFDPPLPARLADAMSAVRYGHAAKLFVPLGRAAPPSAVMSVPERYWTWTATGEGGKVQPVVSAFAGSAQALARLQVDRGPVRWLDSIAKLRGDLDLDTSGAVLSTWADDPWAGAAYSTSPPPELAKATASPLGPLAFAGEHLGGEFAALMEGAIRSGRRAAAALLGSPSGARA
jgi:monoamine oxidase